MGGPKRGAQQAKGTDDGNGERCSVGVGQEHAVREHRTPHRPGVFACTGAAPTAAGIRPRKDRLVYRLLNSDDLNPSLKDKRVYVLWPDDAQWYMGEIEEVRF